MVDTFLPIRADSIDLSKVVSSSCLLVGDRHSCKTSLLFQAAVSKAAENEKVIYIGPEKLSALPLHVHGLPQSLPSITRHIKLMYLTSVTEVIQFLSQIHIGAALPGAILIDDIHFYVNQLKEERSPEQALAKLCALAKDAAKYSSRKSGRTCLLLATASGAQLKLNFAQICNQFFNQIWQIVKTSDLNLTNQYTMLSRTENNLRFHYYIENEEIFLDKIVATS